MAKLKKLPGLRIIRGFKGLIDFYVWKGIPCARTWPSPPRSARNANVQAGWAAFSYASQTWNLLDQAIRDAYNSNASGTNLTGRDIYTKQFILAFLYEPAE